MYSNFSIFYVSFFLLYFFEAKIYFFFICFLNSPFIVLFFLGKDSESGVTVGVKKAKVK